jgi:hypothetical protein
MLLTGETVPMPVSPRLHSVEEVISVFRGRPERVVTFLGFGELGYQDESAFVAVVERELTRFGPRDVVVNTATLITTGFARGVADVYEIARQRGFRTIGVYPSVSLESPDSHRISAFVQDVYFVQDGTWGGYLESSEIPSPTLSALTSVTTEAIAIGGGKHTAQELREFVARGTPARYYALDMNRAISREWYRLQGEESSDYRGQAYHFWSRISGEAYR